VNISVILRSYCTASAEADAVEADLRARYPRAVAIDVERGESPCVHVEGTENDTTAEREVRAIAENATAHAVARALVDAWDLNNRAEVDVADRKAHAIPMRSGGPRTCGHHSSYPGSDGYCMGEPGDYCETALNWAKRRARGTL